MNEVGYVISSRDFLMHLDGLPSARIFDLLQNEEGIRGVVTALDQDKVEAWVLDEGNIYPGQLFKKQDEKLTFPASPALLGRAINPLGVPIDGKGPIPKTRATLLELEKEAPGIDKRQFITDQFITGVPFIDMLIPIGKGQRELLVGDAHSGKTGFLVDLIVNQSQNNTILIIASIGKPITEVRNLIDTLHSNKALGNTVIIAASSMESSPLIFFAPFTAMSLAEYFRDQGKDVLIILDDMGIHAKSYRELSLLGGRTPGRESYPGDIFYVHAHLLERAGMFSEGGSITALPVIEINLNDFTTFIPTNLMSMTDGHLMFKAALRAQGKRPAIDLSLSVSRVGRQTQARIVNLLSQQIRQVLSEAQSLETVSRFSSELPLETQLVLKQADMLTELHSQEPLTKIPLEIQIALLGLVFTSFLKTRDKYFCLKYKKSLFDLFLKNAHLKGFAKSLLGLQSIAQLINKLEEIAPKLKQLFP